MLAGGTEAAVSPIAIAGFANMKALSTNNENPEAASCPFDKKRDGFVMGEGAGVLVLEELEHAKARGAHIYAELAGFAMNCDAYHITVHQLQQIHDRPSAGRCRRCRSYCYRYDYRKRYHSADHQLQG